MGRQKGRQNGGHPGRLYYFGHPDYAPKTLADFGIDARERADMACYYHPHRRKYYFRPGSESEGPVTPEMKRRWALQIAETMAFSFDEIVADLRKIGAWEGYVNVGDLATGGSGE
ncbi:hypothetical protein VTJ04DRAFT_539 [Mycothermus thermophilus]|uniref:uncharacterized protein n=1 Tax=Humicola insolens TaxID=85995 RepID=UPI003742370F